MLDGIYTIGTITNPGFFRFIHLNIFFTNKNSNKERIHMQLQFCLVKCRLKKFSSFRTWNLSRGNAQNLSIDEFHVVDTIIVELFKNSVVVYKRFLSGLHGIFFRTINSAKGRILPVNLGQGDLPFSRIIKDPWNVCDPLIRDRSQLIILCEGVSLVRHV